MTKITRKFTPKFPHFKKRKQTKRKQKYFLIISRKITKHGSELKSNCVLMKSTTKKKLKAIKLIEINRRILKKYSKRCFLYPANKKMKRPWELDIPLALLKEATKIINDKPKKVVIRKKTKQASIDDCEEIQEHEDDFIDLLDAENIVIYISSSSSENESSSPVPFIDDNQNIEKSTKTVSPTKYIHQCLYCRKIFKQQRILNMHIKSMHQSVKAQCDQLFENIDTIDENLELQNVPKCHQCLECGKSFTNSFILNKHKERHMTEPIQNKYLLKSKQNVQSNNLEFPCDLCNRSFECIDTLTRHKNMHQRLAFNRCGICGASFADRNLFLRHSFEHAEEPFVECSICLKRFFKENHLTEHFKSHMTDYVDCNICKKMFKKNQLEEHIRSVHSQDNTRFSCKNCNKCFTRSTNLKIHLQRCKNYL